jgi:hypothetical protein
VARIGLALPSRWHALREPCQKDFLRKSLSSSSIALLIVSEHRKVSFATGVLWLIADVADGSHRAAATGCVPFHALLHGKERTVSADAVYQGVEKLLENRASLSSGSWR